MVYKFFDKKATAEPTAGPSSLERSAKHVMGSGVKKLKDSSLILADELPKPVIKNLNKRKVYSQFKNNIWGVDLADTKSLSKKK